MAICAGVPQNQAPTDSHLADLTADPRVFIKTQIPAHRERINAGQVRRGIIFEKSDCRASPRNCRSPRSARRAFLRNGAQPCKPVWNVVRHIIGDFELSDLALTPNGVEEPSRLFVFALDGPTSRPFVGPMIKVNQVGYLPRIPKVALVTAASPATEFTLRRVDGTVAFRGKLAAAIDDPDSGDKVQAADFSAWQTPGKYYIDVPSIGRSWDFSIAADVYARVFYLAMRSYYGQRCGIAVDLGSEFPGYKHAACHLDWRMA